MDTNKTIKITKEIKSCQSCPFLKKGPHESTDGWDSGQDWFCTNSNNKLISGFVEWHDEKKIKIPDWCPLTSFDFLTKEYLDSIGYELLSDDGIYLKAQNKPGLICPSYGIMGKGKRIIKMNREYDKKQGILMGIYEDGGTRTVFHGVFSSKEEFEFIIKMVR